MTKILNTDIKQFRNIDTKAMKVNSTIHFKHNYRLAYVTTFKTMIKIVPLNNMKIVIRIHPKIENRQNV